MKIYIPYMSINWNREKDYGYVPIDFLYPPARTKFNFDKKIKIVNTPDFKSLSLSFKIRKTKAYSAKFFTKPQLKIKEKNIMFNPYAPRAKGDYRGYYFEFKSTPYNPRKYSDKKKICGLEPKSYHYLKELDRGQKAVNEQLSHLFTSGKITLKQYNNIKITKNNCLYNMEEVLSEARKDPGSTLTKFCEDVTHERMHWSILKAEDKIRRTTNVLYRYQSDLFALRMQPKPKPRPKPKPKPKPQPRPSAPMFAPPVRQTQVALTPRTPRQTQVVVPQTQSTYKINISFNIGKIECKIF